MQFTCLGNAAWIFQEGGSTHRSRKAECSRASPHPAAKLPKGKAWNTYGRTQSGGDPEVVEEVTTPIARVVYDTSASSAVLEPDFNDAGRIMTSSTTSTDVTCVEMILLDRKMDRIPL